MVKPAEIIVNLYKKWRYYSFSKEELDSCKSELLKHNAVILTVICAVSGLLILILSFYPYERSVYHFLFYVFVAIELAGFLYSRSVYIHKKYSSTTLTISMFLFAFGVCAFCTFVYSFCQSQLVTRFLLVFLSFQIIFLFGPHVNILLNLLVAFLFFVMNHLGKKYSEIDVLQMNNNFDVLNVLITALITMTLNWYSAHVVVKGIVTSRYLATERNRFLEDSTHDQLTGLNNRRSYEQSIGFYTSVCRHVHQTVCALMMDVDYFKLYNDFYGHQKGDYVLQAVSRVLIQIAEEEHLFSSRVGGEEFMILWTENRQDEAERVVLRLREMINNLKIPHEKSTVAPTVTASYGLFFMRGGSEISADELYNYADNALYKAKESGRDCIILLDSADKSCRKIALRSPEEVGRR
jgi:diguanylate cyclase (GGDEF)-like protein